MQPPDEHTEIERERERKSVVVYVRRVYDIALHFGDGAEIRPRIERQPPRTHPDQP